MNHESTDHKLGTTNLDQQCSFGKHYFLMEFTHTRLLLITRLNLY